MRELRQQKTSNLRSRSYVSLEDLGPELDHMTPSSISITLYHALFDAKYLRYFNQKNMKILRLGVGSRGLLLPLSLPRKSVLKETS